MSAELLLSLAERVKQASAAEEYGLIHEAWDLLNPGSGKELIYARRCFIALLDAGGFIDAAMTLVPEGWRIGQLEENWRSGRWHCHVTQRPSAALIHAFDAGKTIGYDSKDSEAATPALALCAAALRARATQSPNPSGEGKNHE